MAVFTVAGGGPGFSWLFVSGHLHSWPGIFLRLSLNTMRTMEIFELLEIQLFSTLLHLQGTLNMTDFRLCICCFPNRCLIWSFSPKCQKENETPLKRTDDCLQQSRTSSLSNLCQFTAVYDVVGVVLDNCTNLLFLPSPPPRDDFSSSNNPYTHAYV